MLYAPTFCPRGKCPTLDPFIPQRGTQDAAKRRPQGSTSRAHSSTNHRNPPAQCLPSLARRYSQRPIQARAQLLPALSSPTRPIVVPVCLQRPIGALLKQWAGHRQPLPDKPQDATRWKVEEAAAARAAWRRASKAGAQATPMVSSGWRRDTSHCEQRGRWELVPACAALQQSAGSVTLVIPPPR